MKSLKSEELTQRWIELLGLIFNHTSNEVRRQIQNQVRDQVYSQIPNQAEGQTMREPRLSIGNSIYEHFNN